jgi:cell division protein DivIC
MIFVEIIKSKKIALITILLFFYILLNLLEGERGLLSYLEKKKIKENFVKEETHLISKLKLVKLKNTLLSENLDLDYLEILYRKSFLAGKGKEKVYITIE